MLAKMSLCAVAVAVLATAAAAQSMPGNATLTRCADNFCKVGCKVSQVATYRCLPEGGDKGSLMLMPSDTPSSGVVLKGFRAATACDGKPETTFGVVCDSVTQEPNRSTYGYWADCDQATKTRPATYFSGCNSTGGACTGKTETTVGQCVTAPFGGRFLLSSVYESAIVMVVNRYEPAGKCATLAQQFEVACGFCSTMAGGGSQSWNCYD
jgi:hypothetical protein